VDVPQTEQFDPHGQTSSDFTQKPKKCVSYTVWLWICIYWSSTCWFQWNLLHYP